MNHTTAPQAPALGDPLGASYRTGFTVGEHSARHLRRILRVYLANWRLLDLADAAELALTELVANVVRHVPDRRCSMVFLCGAEGVRVEVADDCPELPVVRAGAPDGDAEEEAGRGLWLVGAVTDAWGVEPRGGGRAGKTVWFECRAAVKTDA
ncbi:ATP-binding protein [Streptomyces cremeus]|uniref:ATP-binding protein n=1 Tax=Streptomyces cremeus TaxID=66881 RepID=A0ABV5PCP7_STRCM